MLPTHLKKHLQTVCLSDRFTPCLRKTWRQSFYIFREMTSCSGQRSVVWGVITGGGGSDPHEDEIEENARCLRVPLYHRRTVSLWRSVTEKIISNLKEQDVQERVSVSPPHIKGELTPFLTPVDRGYRALSVGQEADIFMFHFRLCLPHSSL